MLFEIRQLRWCLQKKKTNEVFRRLWHILVSNYQTFLVSEQLWGPTLFYLSNKFDFVCTHSVVRRCSTVQTPRPRTNSQVSSLWVPNAWGKWTKTWTTHPECTVLWKLSLYRETLERSMFAQPKVAQTTDSFAKRSGRSPAASSAQDRDSEAVFLL